MPSAVNDFEIEPSRERHNGNNNTDRAYRQRTTAPAPVYRLGPNHHDRNPRAHPAGRRSRPSRRVGFCSRLTRRVAFRGCIALAPMAVSGGSSVPARSGGGRLTLMSEVKGRGSDLAFRLTAGRYLVIVIGCTGPEMER